MSRGQSRAAWRGCCAIWMPIVYLNSPCGPVEFTLRTGRRVDAIGLDRHGAFTIVEIKSSVADFRSDTKWREYTQFCDRFYFAVPIGFPIPILPEACGVILADGHGGEIHREAPRTAMNAARRRALTLRFARGAATRLARSIECLRIEERVSSGPDGRF